MYVFMTEMYFLNNKLQNKKISPRDLTYRIVNIDNNIE